MKCKQCSGEVEELRKDWATPVCFACLPTARRIPSKTTPCARCGEPKRPFQVYCGAACSQLAEMEK